MPIELPSDVVEHIRAHFGAEDVDELIDRLRKASESPRLQRCIVVAADGDKRKFESFCDLSRIDYRDVIVAGEYTPDPRGSNEYRRVYDFEKPIPEARIEEGP